MAKDLWESSQKVREMFENASDSAGLDMRKLLFESTVEELKTTDKTQVAITLASLCSSASLRERGMTPEACAGFSLGEYAALCEAGVISQKDVFPMVKLRGELMEKVARGLDAAEGAPGMAAVIGIPAERVASTVESLASDGAYISNYNSSGQVVVSGTARGLAKAEKELKAAGAKRFIRLQVSGPFHSPLMAEARAGLDAALAAFAFSDPQFPVYSNVTGKRIATGTEARELCGRQLVSMVRWVTVEESMLADGCDTFLEAGPGTVLAGLFRALRPDVRCFAAGTRENITKALEAMT
jgi:[acyl-carrier-protein] S-malonyltransferase